jgi:hypothetical protein
MFTVMLVITIFIIFFQYPVLNIKKNWLYKTIIFYLSLISFLFLVGFSLSIISSSPGDSLPDFIYGGLIMSVFGQLVAGIFVFPGLVMLNWAAKDFLF